MNDMEREYRQLCRIDENHGVQGLAQLGRNAIERVTQLESENAYLRAANSDGAEILQKLLAERDQLRARLAAIESAPVVAVVREMKRDFASGPYKFIYYDSDNLPAGCTELIAKPAKD